MLPLTRYPGMVEARLVGGAKVGGSERMEERKGAPQPSRAGSTCPPLEGGLGEMNMKRCEMVYEARHDMRGRDRYWLCQPSLNMN